VKDATSSNDRSLKLRTLSIVRLELEILIGPPKPKTPGHAMCESFRQFRRDLFGAVLIADSTNLNPLRDTASSQSYRRHANGAPKMRRLRETGVYSPTDRQRATIVNGRVSSKSPPLRSERY
jgi:hypothetical protein